MPPLTRRRFLHLGAAGLVLPFARRSPFAGPGASRRAWRAGLIADLHHGLEPTAQSRLEAFVAAATERDVDAIVQLGDFNYSTAEARECIELFDQFAGERHHVLGNHDLDKRTKAQVLEFWSMPARYGSFDRGGFHFAVLDRNHLKTDDGYVPYANGNYFVDGRLRGFCDPEQLEWLRRDLAATELPTVVFVHQGLGMWNEPYPDGDPRAEIEAVFAAANEAGETPKVVACFCGHEHLDRYNHKDGVHYVWVNSASYLWVGEKYGRMAPYRDPLFAFATFDPDGAITIEGRRSEFAAPSLEERGYPKAGEVTASISDRRLGFRSKAGEPAAARRQQRSR